MATEVLVRATHTDAQFQLIDFRLAFVMLIGMVYGLNAGVLAAALASLPERGYLRQSMTLLLLFYEPSNWLSFIVYFVVGASCGYVQLRNAEAVRFVQNENDLLRQWLQFTQELYRDTLATKQLFRRQILSRKDSFGKIYTVTQQLDALQPQEIYHKTVQVIEDVLENHSLTIYRLEEDKAFARLVAASTGMQPPPVRSLEVERCVEVERAIEQNGLWLNRDFVPNQPMYAAGVQLKGRMVVLIALRKAEEDQMTLYYQNLFRILCGLAETALVRAFEYEQAIRERQYLPGTCIMRPEAFAENLTTACTQLEDKMAHHLLLRVEDDCQTLEERCARLKQVVRSNDVAGMGADQNTYLLLNQAKEEDLAVVTRRMAQKGFTVPPVSLPTSSSGFFSWPK